MTELSMWLQENLGWVVGLPIGAILSSCLEIIKNGKKAKEYLKQTKNIKDLLDIIKNEDKLAKDTLNQVTLLANSLQNSVKLLCDKVECSDDLMRNVYDALGKVNVSLEKVQKAQAIMSANNQEMVISGKAEQVNKIIEG